MTKKNYFEDDAYLQDKWFHYESCIVLMIPFVNFDHCSLLSSSIISISQVLSNYDFFRIYCCISLSYPNLIIDYLIFVLIGIKKKNAMFIIDDPIIFNILL